MISNIKTLTEFIALARGQAEDVTAEVVMEGDCADAEAALSELIEAIYASRVLDTEREELRRLADRLEGIAP